VTVGETLVHYLEQRGLPFDSVYLREALRMLAQVLMEAEISRIVDAGPYERVGTRRAYRNGYRSSSWTTSVGEIALQIPKLRKGSYYPAFLDAEHEFLRLAQDAYVKQGLALQQLRTALQPLPLAVLDTRDLADIAERLDDTVYNALNRPLQADYACILLDLIDLVDEGRWRQLLVVLGIQPSGEVALLAHELVSEADNHTWKSVLQGLRQRGLERVDSVISRDYPGVRTAIEATFVDAIWQHHEHYLLRAGGDEALVDAVSRLVLGAGSDPEDGPQMLLSLAQPDHEFEGLWPMYAIA
jgi:transposase-like protein